MTDTKKRRTLIFLALVAILMIAIATALPQLDLGPGIPLPFTTDSASAFPGETATPFALSIGTLTRAILFIFLSLSMAYFSYLMLRGTPIRVLLRTVLSAAVVGLVAIVVIFLLFTLVDMGITIAPDQAEVIPPSAEIKGPPSEPMSPVFIWLACAALSSAIIFLGYQLIRQRSRPRQTSDLLAVEAEQALKYLEMGLDLRSVVVSCYHQMSLVLQKEQDLDLAATMTAREFERLVQARGVPQAPVHELTRLFEIARYGQHPTTQADKQKAIDCLSAIVLHTRLAKEGQ